MLHVHLVAASTQSSATALYSELASECKSRYPGGKMKEEEHSEGVGHNKGAWQMIEEDLQVFSL